MELKNLVFIGFNSRVVALDRDTGETVWQWKSPKGRGYTTVLLDGDRLVVSVDGYTYCLHPITGETIWFNPLKGLGTGVASLASVNGMAPGLLFAAANDTQRQAAVAGVVAAT